MYIDRTKKKERKENISVYRVAAQLKKRETTKKRIGFLKVKNFLLRKHFNLVYIYEIVLREKQERRDGEKRFAHHC